MAEFVPRSQQDIVDSLLAFQTSDPVVAAGILPTDLNEGSLERAHIESIALALEESDQRFASAALSAISESCYESFGFGLLPPQSAIGSVILISNLPAESDVTLPAGAQILGPSGVVFETTEIGLISEGLLYSEDVPVVALTPGVVGNVAPNTLNRFVSQANGIDRVTNTIATAGGSDTETEDARSVRFAAFLRTLVRGTKEALEFAALSASAQIVDAKAIEPFLLDPRPEGIPYSGIVWLYADDGTSSSELGTGVATAITNYVEGFVDGDGVRFPGFKAAGTRVVVKKATRTPVYVRASVSLLPSGGSRWADIQDALTAAANEYFSRLGIGEKASYQNLVAFLSSVDADITEVDLAFWKADPPAYSDPLSAEDISFYDPTDPTTVGSRGILFLGDAPGPSTSTVTYPEWRIA